MARSSPQSFQKRQRERRKQMRRADKLERRLIRNEEKRIAKAEKEGVEPPQRYYTGEWDEEAEG